MSKAAVAVRATDVGPAHERAATDITTQPPDALSVLIERAAKDMAFPLDRLERLITMQREAEEHRLKREREDEARMAKRAYEQSAAKAQAEMVPIVKDLDNAQTRSKYASYSAFDEAIRPIYTAYGFNQRFKPLVGAPVDFLRLCLIVTHDGGHSEEFILDIPADGKGPKGGEVMTRTHANSSAISYGMRDLTRMAWNLATKKASDDDGNAAGKRPAAPQSPPVSEAQVAELKALLEKAEVTDEIIFEHFKIGALSELTVAQHKTAMAKLAAKLKASQ